MVLLYPREDPMGGVALLTGCPLVRFQNRVDEPAHRLQLRMGALRARLLRRNRVAQRLADHPPMHPQLPRDPLDRPNAKLVLASNGLVEFHARLSPAHVPPLSFVILRSGYPNRPLYVGHSR